MAKINGEACFYPLLILNCHKIVIDQLGDVAVTVSYCPLCGTGTSFKRAIRKVPTTFGVSGLLYNSNLQLYDRWMESLWSQISGQAVSGPSKGEILKTLLA